jgi:hypothetical protein
MGPCWNLGNSTNIFIVAKMDEMAKERLTADSVKMALASSVTPLRDTTMNRSVTARMLDSIMIRSLSWFSDTDEAPYFVLLRS